MPRYTDNYNLILPNDNEHYDVDVANSNNTSIDNILINKVNKVAGKGLSECDFTVEYKRKVDALQKIYKPCGSVATYNDLDNITNRNVGDIWNVIDEDRDYCWNGLQWYLLGDTIDLGAYETKEESKLHSYIITTETTIAENTDYTIPCSYKVGEDVLTIYYMGERLIKDVHYKEVGNEGTINNKIQFYNWGQAVPTGRTIEFCVRGVYS